MSSPGCQLRTSGGRLLFATGPNSNATETTEEAPGQGLPGGRTWFPPHPLARPLPGSCPRLRAGSVVGKLRVPGFHPAPPRNVWAGRRVRVLFVCDYWGARVEASSCLHVRVCALGHAWIPAGPCAREQASAMWTRACACVCGPGVLWPGGYTRLGYACTCQFVHRSKFRALSR